ncbi:MAG: hypothetical protein A2Y33_09375 [Spirochaetes bacterium GWF1_51_8]|nr:MAG: hypothetical protein A2Y33_09375 [Spirochaetes bacterium GWF1_51_8]
MISSANGISISEYEVTNIERLGFWLYVDDTEYFVSFDRFPAFKNAPVGQILNVKRLDPSQFNWPDLDIDVDIESLSAPDKYPLEYK